VLLALTTGLDDGDHRAAQKLARQQIEFVAPSPRAAYALTAMRSAGQNLADGVVPTRRR